jgi:alpha-D-ribose 1-methylphosphonate 5-triphosphate diphosphatase
MNGEVGIAPLRREELTAPSAVLIENGTLVTPNAVLEGVDLFIEDGRIAAIEEGIGAIGATRIDARNKLVLPGIVDLHSDALEKFIEPRPGARFPFNIAVSEFDKHVAACGITTMFHCVCFMNSQDMRSVRTVENAERTVQELQHLAPHLNVRNKIHARYDMPTIEAFPYVRELLRQGQIDLLSFMDHTPGQGQYTDIDKLFGKRRNTMSEEEIQAFVEKRQARQACMRQEDIEVLAREARERNVPLASHDDDSTSKVEWAARHGMHISEFPVSMEALVTASQHGHCTGFGAPNYLRGESHSGNISARQALAEGYGDFICSDYAPMAMLHAVFTLLDLGLAELTQLINMVSLNPAMAAGCGDEIGSLEVGKAADVLIVDQESEVPRVSRVLVGGREILHVSTH